MIRAWTPELAFHDEFKPILSLSVSVSGRFATAGADHNIRLWRLDDDNRDSDGCPRVVFLSSISKHTLPVNVVRFSPDGKLLASASDDCNVMLWTQDEKQAEDDTASTNEKEQQPTAESESPSVEAEPLPDSAPLPAAEPVNEEVDNEVICLTPDSPTRSPTRPSHSSTSSSPPATTPPPHSASTALSPPSSPAQTPFASDPDADFSSLNIEQWSRASLLRGHLSEIYALHWSPDGSQLVTGSIEGRVVVWQLGAVAAGGSRKVQRQELSDHNGYVQGVGWDPRGELVVSASSDRTVRVYRWGKMKGKEGLECKLIHTLKGRRVQQHDGAAEEQIDDDVIMLESPARSSAADATAPPSTPPALPSDAAASVDATADTSAPTSSASSSSSAPLFVDETLPSFFRRPAWSPDGLFVLLPAGCYVDQGKTQYCTWLYHRDDFSEPMACLTHTEPSVAAVFSPHPYRPSSMADVSTTSASSSTLPFAYLFVVATTKSLFLYSTHSCHAVASLTNLHLSALTDLAWATQPFAQSHEDDKQHSESAQAGEDEQQRKRSKWATEDRVLVSSSDGYISIVEMQGVAEKFDGEERKQWEEQLAEDVTKARKRIEQGEDTEMKEKKRKKKKKKTADSNAADASKEQSAEGKTSLSGATDGERSDEAREGKSVPIFELTDELKATLQQMVDSEVQVTVDSVREHCKVGKGRASRIARKWKELCKQQRKEQTEAAAKAAAERWEKMDKEQKEKAQQHNADNGKEEKVEAEEGKKEPAEEAGAESGEKKRKERVKAPIVPVEDAKKMKKIDSFFSKSTTPQFAVAEPSSSSKAASSSFSSTSTGSTCLPSAPLPLLPEETPAPGAKRKIVPVLISTLTPLDHSSNSNTSASTPSSSAQPAAKTSASKSVTKPNTKKRKRSTSKASKKAVSSAAAPMPAVTVSQQPTTAPALFAPSQPQSAALPAPSTDAAMSIDLTDEASASAPPAPAEHSLATTATAATDTAPITSINAPTLTASTTATDTAAANDSAAASASPVSSVSSAVDETPSSSCHSSFGAVIVRQGSGSSRVMAGPPPSDSEQPPAKKPKRTIVPTVIAPHEPIPQHSEGQMDNKQQNVAVVETSCSAVCETIVAGETHPMAVEAN